MIKKPLLRLILVVFLLLTSKSLFPLLNIEAQFTFAPRPFNKPADVIGHSTGFGLGIGIDIARISTEVMTQFRLNYTFHNFNIPSISNDNMVHVIFLGIRFIFGNSNFPDWFVIFIEVGYEFLYLSGYDNENTEKHGGAFALGTEFYIYNNLYLGLSVKVHAGGMGFFLDVTPSIGYRF